MFANAKLKAQGGLSFDIDASEDMKISNRFIKVTSTMVFQKVKIHKVWWPESKIKRSFFGIKRVLAELSYAFDSASLCLYQ